jgi:hypothetical protein
VNPELPPELGRIINKALEKDRDLRYQNAAELRGDLKRLKRDTDSHASVAASAVGLIAQYFNATRATEAVLATCRWSWSSHSQRCDNSFPADPPTPGAASPEYYTAHK